MHDQPRNNPHDKPYQNMKGGYGYIADVGYDIFDRLGLEIGVMHTTHDYDLISIHGAIMGASAEKTTFFIKVRGAPWRWNKLELITALGAGFFDISGDRISALDNVRYNEDFSGWGVITNMNLRYHVSGGLAVSFYLGANFVDYNKYSLFGYPNSYNGPMPGGDSINLGITVFHRIGIPQI